MTNAQLKRKLKLLGACSEALEWLGKRDLETAWKECERPRWMLWLAGEIVDRKLLVKAACKCAELVLPIYEAKYPKDKRVRNCIAVTLKWAAGEATLEDVTTTSHAAYVAAIAADAAIAAIAAYAAANAASDVPHEAVREGVSGRAEFESLWQKINGKRASWESNPFVWRIAFRRITT
jgi:hypothetical protein